MGNKSHGVLTLWIFALEEWEKNDEITQKNLDSWKSMRAVTSVAISVGATLMVTRRGSHDDVGSSLNGQQPHPRADIKVAPTDVSEIYEWTSDMPIGREARE
jgi:hypothetical protein